MALALLAGMTFVWIVSRRPFTTDLPEPDETDDVGDYGPVPQDAYRIGRVSPYIH